MKKIGRVEGKVYRKKVYQVFKGEEVVFEGTTDEIVEFLHGSKHVFNTIQWRSRYFKRPLRYRGYSFKLTNICTGERVYAVVNKDTGEEVFRGSKRKIAAEYGYKMATLKTYISTGKPIIRRRTKYNLVPTNEYDIVWKRVKGKDVQVYGNKQNKTRHKK